MQQLFCRDLRAGDVLLKIDDGKLTKKLIVFGQKLAGQANASFVHAGIMFDTTCVIESQGKGVVANDMRMKNRPCGYLVFRPANGALGQGAAAAAKLLFDIHQRQGSMKYNFTGALGSLFGNSPRARSAGEMEKLLDKVLEGKSSRFFCSQFVVYAYQFAASQSGLPPASVFPMRDADVSPSELGSLLARSGAFREIGYLMPNER
jgi:hypothetical protein